jgi:FlaA1/EpsC-like NDP-sugar epimerase
MTIREAAMLVLEAGLLGEGGEIFVLDMGDPIRISELAEHLIRLSGMEPGRDIGIEYRGLRPGEKLHEELWCGSEELSPTRYDKILALNSNGQSEVDDLTAVVAELEALTDAGDREGIVGALSRIFPDIRQRGEGDD